jgi:hypothetical protein
VQKCGVGSDFRRFSHLHSFSFFFRAKPPTADFRHDAAQFPARQEKCGALNRTSKEGTPFRFRLLFRVSGPIRSLREMAPTRGDHVSSRREPTFSGPAMSQISLRSPYPLHTHRSSVFYFLAAKHTARDGDIHPNLTVPSRNHGCAGSKKVRKLIRQKGGAPIRQHVNSHETLASCTASNCVADQPQDTR